MLSQKSQVSPAPLSPAEGANDGSSGQLVEMPKASAVDVGVVVEQSIYIRGNATTVSGYESVRVPLDSLLTEPQNRLIGLSIVVLFLSPIRRP